MAAEYVLVTKSRFEEIKNMEKKMSSDVKESGGQDIKIDNDNLNDKSTLEPPISKKPSIEPDQPPPSDEKSDLSQEKKPDSSKNSDKSLRMQEDIDQLVTKYPHLGTLFNIFSQNPETIKWNSNGSIVIDGEKTIFGSDIIDLMQDTVTNKIRPLGKMAFFRAMAKLNVPSKLIAHAKNKEILAKLKKPPSIAGKRGKKKRPSASSKIGWITW